MLEDSAVEKHSLGLKTARQVGLDCQPHWFQLPPKVRIILGILGSCPEGVTRGEHPPTSIDGEHKGISELESRHLSPLQNTSSSASVSSPNPIPKSFPNLRRIVGHLWQIPSTKSFAAAVRTEPAPTVVVTMQPRGGGRRTGWRDRGAEIREDMVAIIKKEVDLVKVI